MIDICALSDTHNQHTKLNLKPGDLLLHAGDFSSKGYKWEQERFIEWFKKQPYSIKVMTCGNHELGVEAEEEIFKQMCKEAGIIYLNDETVDLQFLHGIVYINQYIPDIPIVKIHGTPVSPWFFDWAWNRSIRDDDMVWNPRQGKTKQIPSIKPHWDKIPVGTNILLTHCPPYEILDELCYVDGTPKGEHVGCPHLAERIKVVKPDLHIFGHIHIHGGCQRHLDGVSYYNAAICDEMYQPSNQVHYIQYDESNNINANKP